MSMNDLNRHATLGEAHMAAIRSAVALTMKIQTPVCREAVARVEQQARDNFDEMACLVSDLDPHGIGCACRMAMEMLGSARSPVASRRADGSFSVKPYVKRWMLEAFSFCPEISKEQRACAVQAICS